MTMKLLTAERTGGDFRFRVHLDTSRTVEVDGAVQPDPEYVLDLTWGAGPRGQAETGPEYTARLTVFEASARREMRVLCVDRLAALSPTTGTPLSGVGATF